VEDDVDRRTREFYRRVLEQAIFLVVYQGAIHLSVHSKRRGELRDIALEDAEAAIASQDARVVGYNRHHPEGPTFEIAGRRANGDEIHVVVAFNHDNPSEATEITLVTVMYPEGDEE
jgi:hypothetical protein